MTAGKKAMIGTAVVAVVALALPASAAHESRMTGGGFVDVANDGETVRVHLGLDLPCLERVPPAAKESRFTVTWERQSFHLTEVEDVECAPVASTGGGSHEGSGAGRCQTRDPLLGTPVEVDAEIEWHLTDGGATQPSGGATPPHGKPTSPPGKPTAPPPSNNPDTISLTIDGLGELCDLTVDGTLQGGQLQLHQ